MVFFNYTTLQASAKIVYYGPGLCGKTTNLQHIHAKTDPHSRGEMVSLETEADRTLFFDLLPLEVGTIGGMRVRLQLYTVPGQVFYNTTRKLVLKGVDGVVFVADSQVPALEANRESFENLRTNLEELNQPFEKVAFIFQYNKRDLRNIHPIEVLNRSLNPNNYDVYEAAALHGVGVFETLKAISKKTLAAVHRRISGEEAPPERVVVPSPVPPAAKPSPAPAEVRPKPPARPAAPVTPRTSAETVQPGTDEVKVEFASSARSAEASGSTSVPVGPIPTQSPLDVERELDELREIAWGSKPSSPAPAPAPTPAKKTTSTEMLTSGDLGRRVQVKIPQKMLEKAKHLFLDLSLGGDGPAYKAADKLRVDIPSDRAGKKPRLRITLDIESEED